MAFPQEDDFDDDYWEEHRPSVTRLSKDLQVAGQIMGLKEARFLVDSYYTAQNQRKRANSQRLALAKGADVEGKHPEPHVLLDWLFDQSHILELEIHKVLNQFTLTHMMGDWMRQVVGIGPVISAGIIANLERPRPTVGQIYAFAGIAGDGQKPWLPGKKRPYSTRLKTVCWHAGQCFMRLHNHDDCFYGKLYKQRKLFEVNMNESGQRRELALSRVSKVDKSTDAYKYLVKGKLPPAAIDGRARRYAVKIFLSHVNEIWLERTGQPMRVPFAIEKLGHQGYIPPPFR